MTNPSSKVAKHKLTGLAIALAIAGATLAIVVRSNFERIDSLIGTVIDWNFGSGKYVAIYDDFLLTVSSDNAIEFSSGRGRNSLSKLRIEFSDGNVIALPNVSPLVVETHFPDADKMTLIDNGLTIVRYSIGFDRFDFVDSELEGVTLSKGSKIGIDFGNGQFINLPIDRKKILKLLGPPKTWERVRGGPP